MSDIAYSLVLVLLPMALLIWGALNTENSWLTWFLKSLAIGLTLLSLFYLLDWSILSYYLRYFFLFLFFLVLIFSALKSWHKPVWKNENIKQHITLFISGILLLLNIPLLIQFNKAFKIPGEPVNLTFPLKNGKYFISHGGNHYLMNEHVKSTIDSLNFEHGQSWAVDIQKLNVWGNRASKIYPSKPEDYNIYNEPVFAPCTGTVLQTRNDISIKKISVGVPASQIGNYAVIQCRDSVFVVISNLKRGSLAVREGLKIETGDYIGKVGKSILGKEPHLEISAQKNMGDSNLFEATPLPITFSGKFLVRNEVINQAEKEYEPGT